jgi:hypothetical protein
MIVKIGVDQVAELLMVGIIKNKAGKGAKK